MSDVPSQGFTLADYQRLLSENIRRKEHARDMTAKLAAAEKALSDMTAERDEYAEHLNAIAAERDDLKATLETRPDELRSKIDELTGQIRGQAHREKFKVLAKDKVNPEAIDTAWGLLGWQPDADDVDEVKMRTAIDDLVGRHAVLKIAAQPGANGGGAPTTTATYRAAGPGTGRGAQPAVHDPQADLAIKYPNPGRLA